MNTSDTQPETLAEAADEEAQANEKPKLTLKVSIAQPSACERRVSVTIAREDVDRYLEEALAKLMPSAAVPGFRAGRAPKKLVEQRYRDQVDDQVKGSLLMDSMAQISDEYEFSAISEPSFELDAIDLPEKGPMTFEFDLEVRPEFDLPEWKGLHLERLTREFTSKDVDRQLDSLLKEQVILEPHDGAAELDDFVVVDLQVKYNGDVINEQPDVTLQVRSALSFPDARVDGFDKLMVGARTGDQRSTTVFISHDAAREDLQGQNVELAMKVTDVQRGVLPELDEELLRRLGNFSSEGDLRDAVLEGLRRRLQFEQQQRTRQQITTLLTQSAKWDLPPDLVRRQARRELERAVLELRSSGFSDNEIRAYENELRQNSISSTRKALHEHFILERIAEEEHIEAEPDDYENEVRLIAEQTRESPRRVRARIEKKGWMDALRNQIIERKVLELITSHAHFRESRYEPEKKEVEAVPIPLCGRLENEIPEAKHAGESQPLPQPVDRS